MLSRLIYPDHSRRVQQAIQLVCALFLGALLSACNQPPLPYPPITPSSKLIVLIPEGPLDHEPSPTPHKRGSGFNHDLVAEFAASRQLDPEFITTPTDNILEQLRKHKAHLAAGWIHGDGGEDLLLGPVIAETQDILVHTQSTAAALDTEALRGKTVHFLKGTHAAYFLNHPSFATERENLNSINFQPYNAENVLALLEKVANQEIEYAIVDKASLSLALNFYPNLDYSLKVGKPYSLSWIFPANTPALLIEQARDFILNSHDRGDINRLLDRYLGHTERLTLNDRMIYVERIKTVLPQFRSHFITAQEVTGIDWRLLAALAYQESAWDPLATSQTNVRGMMMLTEDTAQRIGVSNRLDARQSIVGGSRYLQMLRRKITTTPEPDRTWQALAAYNLGLTNLYLARQFATKNDLNPDSWYDMKKALPQFAKVSRARGGEAVIMTESIRLLYDTLKRYEPPHLPKHNKKGQVGKH